MVGRRGRLLALLVAVAVAAAAAGWVAGLGISSPTDAAGDSRPPEPSLITAPVERRVLTTTIVTRGDARFAASTELAVDPSASQGGEVPARPVVTGRLPGTGEELAEGDVAVEVSGRPVFLLGGELPMYRALAPGTTGPDVAQLEAALRRLGFSPGRVDQVFDAATGAAVEAWYEAAGYQPAPPAAGELERLATAEAAERAARDALAVAEAALTAAGRGPSRSEVIAAEGEVVLAREELDKAVADRRDALAAAAPEDRERVRREHDLLVLRAEHQLTVAQARCDELVAPPNTTLERSAVDRAEADLAAARATLDDLRAGLGIGVPRGEVVFLPELPRRVEEVQVGVGDEPAGPVLTLSGAQLQIETSVTAAERALVSVGDLVRLDEEAIGIELTGTIVAVSETPDEDGGHRVRVRPADPDTDQLIGVNLRVTIPIESTDGEVLAVPVAAVTTAADGTSRVRVMRPDGATEDVAVRVGLAADGFLEVTPAGQSLAPGDDVVLGLR